MLRFLVLIFVVTAASAIQERFLFFGSGEPKLEKYNVDKSKISVSGFSAGATMATQMHVIFSKTIMGAGLIAGVPFACSGGTAVGAAACLMTPTLVSPTYLEAFTEAGATSRTVDHTSYLANDRVYIFNGMNDTVCNPGAGPKIKSFYSHYIHTPSHIKTVFNVHAQHGQPTDGYGTACDQLSITEFMNDCNYSAAFDLLNHIYDGTLAKPSWNTAARGDLMRFDQTEYAYMYSPVYISMDDVGYMYIPTGCKNKIDRCKLHIAFHGCGMGQSKLGDTYVRHAGYNEVGEVNDIIIVYPQVVATALNLQGCWDWYGYTGIYFESHLGYQPDAIKKMIDRITG